MQHRYFPRLPLLFFTFLLTSSLSAQQIDLEWIHAIGSADGEEPGRVIVDACGNVYATGWFRDSVDLDPGPGIHMVGSNGDYDVYLIKFDSTGTFQWAHTFGGAGFEDLLGLTTDLDIGDGCGSLVLTGSFSGTVDFDPGTSTTTRTSNGNQDVYVLKFDGLGNFSWVQTFGGTSVDFARFVSLDDNGDVFVSGAFSGTADFDPGLGTDLRPTVGQQDGFFAKLDPNGNVDWVNTLGSSEFDRYTASATDDHGNIYAIGTFQETADFDPDTPSLYLTSTGQRDYFLQKLDPNGQLLWAFGIGGFNGEDAHDLVVDHQGNVTIAGTYGIDVDFDPGPGTELLTPVGDRDIYVVQYDSLGNFKWVYSAGEWQYDQARAIAVDDQGYLFITGTFQDIVDFDPGPGVSSLGAQGEDVFLLCLNPNGQFQWVRKLGGVESQFSRSLQWRDDYLYYSGSTMNTLFAHFDNGLVSVPAAGAHDAIVAKIKLASVVSVPTIDELAKIAIYPNPTNGLVRIDADASQFHTISLVNVQGQTLIPPTSLQPTMDLSHLPKGLYVLRLEGDSDVAVQRVVRQ